MSEKDPSENDGRILRKKKEMSPKYLPDSAPKRLIKKPRTRKCSQHSHRKSTSFGEGNGTPLQYFCWKILWTEKPGRLQSMGSQRVRYD